MTKIMIVDDSLRARRALKALISQQAGIDSTPEASNGQEALHSMEREKPEVVIMDVCMPVMDGLDALRVIKAKWPRTRVIVLTMYPENRTEAFEAGADAFLLKGCPVEEILSSIHNLPKSEKGGIFSLPGNLPAFMPPQIMYSPHT